MKLSEIFLLQEQKHKNKHTLYERPYIYFLAIYLIFNLINSKGAHSKQAKNVQNVFIMFYTNFT